jgi:prepilin-type N-terminal cleavage/methylation domain-containing protein
MRLRRRGFTLIEIMVVVAIVGVLSGLAVWSMNSFMANMRLSADASTIASFIRGARNKTFAQGCPHVVRIVVPPAGSANVPRISMYRKQNCSLAGCIGSMVTSCNDLLPVATDVFSSTEPLAAGRGLELSTGGATLTNTELYVAFSNNNAGAIFGQAGGGAATVIITGPGTLRLSNEYANASPSTVEVATNGSVKLGYLPATP